MRTSTRLALVTTLLFWAFVPPASADPQSEARARFRDGRSLFRRGDPAGARAAFEEAYRILPNPRVLANIAACLAAEDRPVEAVRTYRRFLHEGGDEVPADGRREARRELERLRAQVGDLILAVEPEGADVLVDGTSVGTAPLTFAVALAPGVHLLAVRAEGHRPFARDLEVAEGGEVNLSVVLQELTDMPTEAAGPQQSADPEPGPEPEPGPGPGRQPDRAPLGRGPLLLAGVGLTAALAVGAAVTGILTLQGKSEYEDPDTSIARRNDLYDSTGNLATVTDVLVWSAVGVGVATLGLYLFAGPDGQESSTAPVALRIFSGGLRCDLLF